MVELVDCVPANTVYPGNCKGRGVTWEGGQERLQHFSMVYIHRKSRLSSMKEIVYSL